MITTVADERERPVLELLDEMGIQYRRYEHPCARTMHDCEGIGADIGAQHFKNLFLCNRSGTRFYLLLIRADKLSLILSLLSRIFARFTLYARALFRCRPFLYI